MIVAVSLAPLLVVAMTFATPAARPVATPASETDATDGADDTHITVATPIESPTASTVAALSGTDWPTKIVVLSGRTRTPVRASLGVVGALQATIQRRTRASLRMAISNGLGRFRVSPSPHVMNRRFFSVRMRKAGRPLVAPLSHARPWRR